MTRRSPQPVDGAEAGDQLGTTAVPSSISGPAAPASAREVKASGPKCIWGIQNDPKPWSWAMRTSSITSVCYSHLTLAPILLVLISVGAG